MRLSRTKRYVVSMGDGTYEMNHFDAQVSLTHHDLGYNDEEWAALAPETRVECASILLDNINHYLNEMLADDIAEAAALTDNRRSYILEVASPSPQPLPPAPAPAKRTIRRTT